MRISHFTIKNFKGVRETKLELATGAPGRIITLIGLNESGKTTILEALSNFVSLDSDTQTLVETIYSKVDARTFIPKDRRGRFTDSVTIKAAVELDQDDVAAVKRAISRHHNANLLPGSLSATVVEKAFHFKDSLLDNQIKYWTMAFQYTKGFATKVHSGDKSTDAIWQTVVRTLGERLPEIVYFPTFLFDMPDRIYLSPVPGETIKSSYYRRVISDVLKAVDPEYSVQTHIIKRVEGIIASDGVAALGSEKSDHVDSVVRDISNEISRVIMGAWKDILEKEVLDLRVELKWGVDGTLDNAVYVEPYIVERQQYKYLLKERSLGFRWFFSFLLFTQFRRRGNVNKATIFLFDEPASHLHSAAQMELLGSFPRIMGREDYIVYSTHSHYMINPLWLEKAYIINNNAVDIAQTDIAPYQPNPNDVVGIRYKRFVAENPTRMTYFQPVLDALKVRISRLDLMGPAVIVEGKFDYHPFVYLHRRLEPSSDLRCFAAQGAGEMAVLSSLFRGWGVPFVILLDADKKGKAECQRYRGDYHLTRDQVFTLDEADPSLDGLSFESLYKDDVTKLIKAHGLDSGGQRKAEGAALFQLLVGTEDASADVTETLAAFAKILAHVQSSLAKQGS